MTDKFIFPDDTVCLFYLQVIENTSDWNLLIRKVQIKIDRWIFSAVLAQKNPEPRRIWRFKKWLHIELHI